MIVETQVTIDATKEAIWAVLTDIENGPNVIQSLEEVEILERPESGLRGLKWRETRTMFGKTATEVMWITDFMENEFFKTRAESHGFVYLATFRISEHGGARTLSMSHVSQPQGLFAKTMGVPMGLLFKGVMRKAVLKDLNDIKNQVEG